MSELNPVAKRMYNVTPEPLRLSLDDGTTGVFELSSAEFFQQEFQAEGKRVDGGDEAAYRFTTSDDNASVLVGRQTDDGDWALLGAVVAAERASTEANAADGADAADQ
jgi:hypothetical protein